MRCHWLFIIQVFLKLSLESNEFVLFTQPKTATHLLIPILAELTGKTVYWAPEYAKNAESILNTEEMFEDPQFYLFSLGKAPWDRHMMDLVWTINDEKGTFLHLHAPFSLSMEAYLKEKNCINIFIQRDPRDQIVSLLNHYRYIHWNDREVERISSDHEKLLYMIKNNSKNHSIHYLPWIYSPQCCVLNFEKLMGSRGGAASDEDALLEMKKIAAVLDINLSDAYLKEVYEKHWGNGWGFFKGKVGAWKEYFHEDHKSLMKEEIGDLLILLGYEKDLNW